MYADEYSVLNRTVMQIHYITVWICVAALPVNSDNVPITGGKVNHFQYVNAPAYDQYEFAYNLGSPDHQISRHEQSQDGNFQAKVKWSDTYEGVGGSYYDYNHGSPAGKINSNYNQPIYYYPRQPIPDYTKSEDITANSEYQPDYAYFEEKNDDDVDLSTDEPESSPLLADDESKSPSIVAAALIQMPQKNIETLFRLPSLSVAQHLLNVYSLVEHQ